MKDFVAARGLLAGIDAMKWRLLAIGAFGVVLTHAALAREQAVAPVATVNGEAVLSSEVDYELRRAFGASEPPVEARINLEKGALEQVIDRRLVLHYLTKTGQAASQQDVDLELTRLETDLKAQDITLRQHCEQTGQSLADLRRALAWQLSWKRYLQRQLTDANLEKYFTKYAREFDGTQLRVAQILLKLAAGVPGDGAPLNGAPLVGGPAQGADGATQAAALQRAGELRQEIVAGKISFAAAAQQHSQAPSASSGGDIGWIERRWPMPEDFSRAAFGLQPGEVSLPLVSPFGVHLITVLEVRPGMKTWRDTEAELRPAVALYLFRWIADRERATAKIEYAP